MRRASRDPLAPTAGVPRLPRVVRVPPRLEPRLEPRPPTPVGPASSAALLGGELYARSVAPPRASTLAMASRRRDPAPRVACGLPDPQACGASSDSYSAGACKVENWPTLAGAIRCCSLMLGAVTASRGSTAPKAGADREPPRGAVPGARTPELPGGPLLTMWLSGWPLCRFGFWDNVA